ncbi:CPBP family intramembrane glutamic endopeptidase [Natrinema sp. 1APR25-10V2]|uniref:CPBP family intramembrane glutamic endopeptidase n=1 Tax=Natrinema sp. 1APR25-10V2 TaxID=2951081 RepID=UPI002874880C|nr:CPBP family intramembrane glutamic endopeptidase [Natrinema sp. 1APR25-10V2]MDS0477689.1 CPBP family intramembrane metalloprotease [Natrinema sp. 1APR25-10V2]
MIDRRNLEHLRGFDVWGFLLFSHGWTWLWWSVPIAAGWHVFRFPGIVFLLVGGVGVTIGGVVMSWLVGGRTGLGDLWRRLVDVRLIPRRWLPVVLALWPALALVGAAAAIVVDGASHPLRVEPLLTLLADPIAFAGTLLAIFLLGPFHEEIGWRGYWLDRLQLRWNALSASLVLGVAWAAWHAPLFLMVGYFSSWDFAPDPAAFAFNIVVGAVLYTWLYNNSNRSVLAAILFHFVGNATGQLLELSPAAETYQTAATVALVVAVVLWWGPVTLRRGAPRPLPSQ